MDTIKQNFQTILEQAKKDGVKVELMVAGGEDLSIGYMKNKLDSFESTQTQMAGFRVISGASQGYAYTENLSLESLQRTYNEALSNSRTVKNSGGVEVPLARQQTVPDMSSLYAPENIEMDKKMEIAKWLEEKCLAKDKRVQSVPYSGFSEATSFKRILNSEGLDQEFKQSYYTGSAASLAKEGESSKMDGEGFFARSFADINIEEVTSESVRKSVSRLGASKLKTGNYPVVIDRYSFPMILAMIQSYFSAKEVHEGKSLLAGKLNQPIASPKFTLIDDPFDMRGTSVRPFDDEGNASQKTTLLENGVLKNYLTNLEYSTKMQLPLTAHARRSPASPQGIAGTNWIVQTGDKSLEQLLSSSEKVVHLTKFAGGLHAGFKDSTGDFSMPAEGFLYENGKCVGAIDQFVMSGNVLELLRDIVEVGNTHRKPGSSSITPDVLVKSLSFAGA